MIKREPNSTDYKCGGSVVNIDSNLGFVAC